MEIVGLGSRKEVNKIKYVKDDIITIPHGDDDKHKTILEKGEKIRILFFSA